MKKRLIVFLLALVTAVSASGIPGVTGIKAYCDDTQSDDTQVSDTSDGKTAFGDSDKADLSESSQKISFSNIKSIMMQSSIDMQIAENTLNNSKQQVTQINDAIQDLGYSGPSISSSIKSLEDEIESLEKKISGLDSTDENYAADKAKYEKDKTDKEQILSKLKQYKTQRTNAARSYKKAQISYDQTVQKNVYQAQKDFVSYLSTVADIEQQKSNIELKEKEAQTAKLKYDSGFLSKKDYDSANTDNADLVNKLNESKSKEEIALKNLKLSLGISQGEDVTISDDIQADFDAVLSINYEDDLKEMLEKNKEMTLMNMQLDWDNEDEEDKEDDDHDYINYSIENSELNLEKKSISSEINFKQQYNNLMNSYNSLKASYEKIQTKQESYALSGKKYSFGFVSKNDLEQSKIDLDKDTAAFNNSRNQFYLDYLNYIQMKEGY